MHAFSTLLREAREKAGLDVDAVARILDLAPELLGRYEVDLPPPLAVLERYATTFGTPLRAFLEGEAVRSPATLLFRSAAEHGSDLGELLQSSDLRVLGDFLVCVSEVAELEHSLAATPRPLALGVRAPDISDREWEQGRDLALAVRRELGLDSEPIDSMVSLLQDRLDVLLFFVDPEQLHTSVQGASTLAPRPAILVNLLGGRHAWWTTRVSLAHEFCHLLFDFHGRAQSYLLSPPGGSGAWHIIDRFQAIERRANAFAVHFLAPGEGIRQVLGGRAPDTEDAIDVVCQHFGVGRTVAVRRLGHEFRLSSRWQEVNLDRPGTAHESSHADASIPVGLRAGRIRNMVGDALEREVIDSIDARQILRVPLHAALEFEGFRDEPVISEEKAARSKADALAHARGETNFWSTGATQTEQGWDVELHWVDGQGKLEVEIVHLTHGFEHVGG